MTGDSSYAGFSLSLASLITLQMPKCHQLCDYLSCADVDAADNDDDCFWSAGSDMSPLLEQESTKHVLYCTWQDHEGSTVSRR
jgi:hypothetical protein